jgi:2,3-bisphosphoglycerate-independent phosphoglycerate mutase
VNVYKFRVLRIFKEEVKMKKLLILIDGMGDISNDFFKGKTPLEAANVPNLNDIAKKSKLGFMYPVNEDFAPESDNAILAILGNELDTSVRAELEALGYGLKVKRGDLVLRANFGTVDNLNSRMIIDRRAGRTLTTKEARQLADTLNKNIKLPAKFEFIPTVQHRGILVFYGGFSENMTNTDTYIHEKGKIYVKNKFDWAEALDDDENTEFSVNLVNSFVTQAHNLLQEHPINKLRIKKGLLPANIILTRDAGIEIPGLNKFRNAMAIVNMPLERGIARASGMRDFSMEYPEMKGYDAYENLKSGLRTMADFTIKTLKKKGEDFNFCYVHFKETDVPGHDNKPLEKKSFFEILDKEFFRFLKKYIFDKKINLILTADHSTPCKMKTHTSDPVPVLFYNSEELGDNLDFNEKNSLKGSLGKIYGKQLLKKLGFVS